VSDGDIAGVTLTGTPLPGTFSLDVVDLGTYASSLSKDGLTAVSDPASSNISSATSFTLQVGSASHLITPASNTLTALAEAINLSTDANVQATIVNIGSPSAPDYRLSLQGIKLGDLPIQLTAVDGSNPGQVLTSTQTTGSTASYRVNGQPATPITSDTRVVTISPGVTVTLYAEGTTEVTVSRSTNAVSSALSRFVTAYNAVQSAIDRNRGEEDGPLQGQSLLITLTSGLHRLSEYTGGDSGLNSLTALGLSFDRNGVLSFDSVKFSAATTGKVAQLASFFGATGTGGFLKSAADTLDTLSGDEGVLGHVTESVRTQITATNEAIAEQDKRIDTLRLQVEARMAAADAAIAALEQQYNYISGVFSAMSQAAANR